MAPPIRTRPSFPHSQSLPSGSFHKPLILIPQRADRRKDNHRKLIKLITWTTALSNSMKLWAMPSRVTQEMGTPDHLTCLLRNLYSGQEATIRTRHGTIDWFQIGKGVHQGYTLSPCLFNLYAEYIMWNAGLNEAQAGIKTAGRSIKNLRYAGDTTLMVESKEKLKSFLMKVKEESEKVGLKLNILKLRSWHPVPLLHGNRWGNKGNSERLYFGGLQIHCRWWLQSWKKDTCSLEEKLWPT